MKNRKRGFSLVELLIVLAVIAALIATITPVAMNAIKKAKATQVAQNLKTLASAFENGLYVSGADFLTGLSIGNLGRDIKTDEYAVYYTASSGSYTANIVYKGDGDITLISGTLSEATTGTFASVSTGYNALTGTGWVDPSNVIYYQISFNVY